MDVVRRRRFSIKDFRTLPEFEPSLEFFDGKVVQKMSPKLPHSIIQGDLLFALMVHAKPTNLGRAYPELRCTFGGCSHVFDLSFFVRGRMPDPANAADRVDVLIPPDLAVEILSPGQTVGELGRKHRSAIRRGVRLGWLIDERRRQVHVLHPTRKARILGVGDVLEGEDVLPGFTLAVAELFGWVEGN